MNLRVLFISFTFVLAAPAFADDLLLYAPFDGSADAAIARGDGRNFGGLGGVFTTGIRGQALDLRNDCLFAAPGNFRPGQGTMAVWVRPHWNGGDRAAHYVFCIYGKRELQKHAWAVNRWSVAFGGGRCAFTIYTQTEGKTLNVSAPISDWKAGEWHHVAVTWGNVNSGKADGEMRLYLDGVPAAVLDGKQIDVGPTDRIMAIGRDQTNIPSYGDADFDDLFIYGRALTAGEIAEGVKIVKSGELYDRPARATAHSEVKGWWNAAWPFRAGGGPSGARNASRERLRAVPVDPGRGPRCDGPCRRGGWEVHQGVGGRRPRSDTGADRGRVCRVAGARPDTGGCRAQVLLVFPDDSL